MAGDRMKRKQLGAILNPFKKGLALSPNLSHQTVLEECLKLATSPGDINAILNEILAKATHAINASGGYALNLDQYDPGVLTAISAYSPSGNFNFPSQVAVSNSVSGQAKTNRQPILISATDSLAAGSSEFGDGVQAVLAVPLYARSTSASLHGSIEDTQGTLTFVGTERISQFDQASISTAQSFAHIFSMALANAQNEYFRRTQLVESLEQISNYIETKDPNRRDHAARTAQLAAKIAAKFELSDESIEEIRVAATLMDIGYAAIPEAILQKPDGLTEQEFMMIRMHPVISFEICQKLGLPQTILTLIRHHHEKLDGSGYPDQLKNNDIPLLVRILSTADAFDAMRCNRAHRAGLNATEAMKQLVIDAGSKFDPTVVQALRDLVEAGAIDTLYGDVQAA